jgi:DNA-binding response OmpR family regulator
MPGKSKASSDENACFARENLVRQLRKKIEDDPHHPQYLLTDAYVGYRFNEHASDSQDTSMPAAR